MKLPPEVESGNIEYKLKITTDCDYRIEQLATQMKWRLNEGNGIAKYLIGVADDGSIKGIESNDYNKSLKNFNKITKIIDAKIVSSNKIEVTTDPSLEPLENNLFYYEIKVTSDTKNIHSTRIIFIGPTNSGKSTVIGNLIKKTSDNGNGKSRKFVFNHKHEIYSGETSSISIKNIRRNYNNKIFNINLIDTPGNIKYQKTMFTCIYKYRPNLIILMIDPLEIDIKQLLYYLNLLKYFRYPFYIIFTKSDKYDNIHKNYILKNILEICKKDYNDVNINKIPYIEINNITLTGYKKLDNIIKYYSHKSPTIYETTFDNYYVCNPENNSINVQICDILNVPNMSKIYTGLTLNKFDITKKYILTSPSFEINNIKINSIFFLDKPKQQIDYGHLITFTINNDIEIDNKSDLILSSNVIEKVTTIYVKSDDKINNTQGICIYNNQYNVIKIKHIKENIYMLTNIDNSQFINLSNKIIVKVHDIYYYTERVNIISIK